MLELHLGRNWNAPYITSPEEVLGRMRAVDPRVVKRLLEPEPYPWPENEPKVVAAADGQPVDKPQAEYEPNIDRLGGDFDSFTLPDANPRLCQRACQGNARCKAWTYVKPDTIQGPQPRCWLKSTIPRPLSRTCCVSGVTRPDLESATGIPNDTTSTRQPPGAGGEEYDSQPDVQGGDGWSDTGVAVATGVGALAAGGIAGLGAWLALGQAGVGRREAFDAMGDLLRGRLPDDGFEAWKAEYEAKGWTYREENGVAIFDPPVDYAEPPTIADLPTYRDGDTNPDTGEVWSDEDGGWIGRNLYEEEQKRCDLISDINARRTGQDEDVKKLYDEWQGSKQKLEETREKGRVQDIKWALDDKLDVLSGREDDPDRKAFFEDLRSRVEAVDESDSTGQLQGLRRAVGVQFRPGFEVDYTYDDALRDSAVHGGAMLIDLAGAHGAATVSLHAYERAQEAYAGGATVGEALGEGFKTGVETGFEFAVMGKAFKIAGSLAKRIPGVTTLIEKAGRTEINLFGRAAPAEDSGTRIWGSRMDAIREEINTRAANKLPADHPMREIGRINEALSKAGSEYNPRLVNAHMRLDPGSQTYQKGLEALTKDPKLLTEKSRMVADAVRQDLNMRSVERGLEKMYEAHPELKGSIEHIENVGSHARRGMNYRPGESDFDFRPKGNGTEAGRQAEELLGKYQADAVEELSGGRLTVGDIKSHSYGGNQGTGAFRSRLGLKVKDLMSETSGRIDVVNAEGKITHSLRGGDAVQLAKPGETFEATRLFERGTTPQAARAQVTEFRSDLINKFMEERPEMKTAAEEVIQAAKGFRLAHVVETKMPGGMVHEFDAELLNLARNAKSIAPTLSKAEATELTNRLLDALK
ncbi:MAG: PAN domain-containing protein [Nitratireductor sp.]|nr:PAN domain-containing protein [Nitratireductor sp.]